MLGEEELVQQLVDLEKRFAIEPQTAVVKREKALFVQLSKARCEPFLRVNTKLPAEVVAADMAELHLQNELANHAFFMRGSKGSVNGKLSFLQPSEVRSPVVLVLEVRPTDV